MMSRKEIFGLAWPVMAEMFLQTFTQIVSMVLVGHLGASAVTSIGLSMQPLNVFYALFQGIGVGGTAIVARMTGGGDDRGAGKAAAQAVSCSAVLAFFSAIFMFFQARRLVVFMGAAPDVIESGTRYLLVMTPGLFFLWISTVLTGALRGAGDTRFPMKVNVAINLVNFVGNVLLVYGLLGFPALGVFGAGLATTLARLTGAVILFNRYLSGKTVLVFESLSDLRPDAVTIRRVARVGIPGAVERVVISVGQVFYAQMVAGLGTVSYAAHAIGVNAESISFMPGNGFSTAATTLVGKSLGAGRPDLARESAWESVRLGCLFVGVMGVGLYFFPDQLMGVFTTDAEVIRLGAIYLRIMAFCQIHQAVGNILMGALRGAGDTKFVMYITAVSSWCIRLGLTYYLLNVVHTGVVGAWWGMTADTLFRAIAALLWFRSGRWISARV
jgi:putative MATE family efflux protein